jgi:hypothetical protein
MRIQSVSPEGIVAEYSSIQAAGRAGYSVQRVHACIHGKAKTHRDLSWRRVDGLHAIPLFVAERISQTLKKLVPADLVVDAFLAWLPEDERGLDREAILAALAAAITGYCADVRVFFKTELRPSA